MQFLDLCKANTIRGNYIPTFRNLPCCAFVTFLTKDSWKSVSYDTLLIPITRKNLLQYFLAEIPLLRARTKDQDFVYIHCMYSCVYIYVYLPLFHILIVFIETGLHYFNSIEMQFVVKSNPLYIGILNLHTSVSNIRLCICH